MDMNVIHVCSFTCGIGDMKRKDQRDPIKVLAALRKSPRYSAFEASANNVIARTIYSLSELGLIENDSSCGYPWTIAKITELGESVLNGSPMPPKPDEFDGFMRIGKNTYVSESIAKRKRLTEYKDK